MTSGRLALFFAAVGLALVMLLGAPPAAEAALPFKRCSPDSAFRCGRLSVPLDRTGTVPGRVSLFVIKVPAHRRGGATKPPLVVLAGGPGQSASDAFAFATDLLEPARRDRDIIIYDQRGTGRSGLLRCRSLERSNLFKAGDAAAACARQLGPRRAFYTSRDTADDIDALRARLGAQKVALYGTSYGTKVALGYALRYPAQVDRLVLDSVVEAGGPDPFYLDSFAAAPRALTALCRAHCGWTSDVVADVSALVKRIARGPLRGRVIDRHGRGHILRLTRVDVFSILFAGDFDPTLRAAFPGSVGAALRGDPAPLLRLRRRAFQLDAEPPPPRALSSALYAATTCEEAPLPWARSTPPDAAERHRQAEARAATIPDSEFEPFDRATALASDVLNLCERWPNAPLAPDFGPGPLPDVPVLLLEGEDDLRTPVENAQRVATQFPRSSLVVAPATGHSALGSDFSGCTDRAFKRFFEERPVATRCLHARRLFKPAPPPPRRLSQVSPLGAKGRPGRTLAASIMTLGDVAEDSITELFFVDGPAVASGGGLRAGHYSIDRHNTLTLDGVAFVPGVTLTGRLEHFGERRQRGRLRVGGGAAAHGSLRLRGGRVSGRLGGRRVRVGLYARRAISALAAQQQHRWPLKGR
ncbi:MAG TPA: alpha/beta hydrolase [Thermoleophilaceae bacterium]|nr:alpha/beta hydrolase [Thermoleophilaceae bacterium]